MSRRGSQFTSCGRSVTSDASQPNRRRLRVPRDLHYPPRGRGGRAPPAQHLGDQRAAHRQPQSRPLLLPVAGLQQRRC